MSLCRVSRQVMVASMRKNIISSLIPKNHQHGFSLVEIMVGIAIGLLGVLIIMQVSAVFEGQKRTTTTGSDAQTTGVIAFYTLERDLRRAGYGLSDPSVLGCNIKRYYDGAPAPDVKLTPVVITNGTDSRPDTIHIFASGKGNWSVPNRLIVEHPATAFEASLNTTLGIAIDDLLIIYSSNGSLNLNCTMFQVTGPLDSKNKLQSGSLKVEHKRGTKEGEGIWNPDSPSDLFPVGGYPVGSLVFNLGAMIDHTYSLDAGGNLILTDPSGVRAIAADVVNLQAEYGFDTRTGIQAEPRVDTWSATMIDADGSGVINDAGDIARIVAVRMALVVRSALMEKPGATGACDTTIVEAVGSRPANAPSWAAGTIDVSKQPNGDANANWQCYRYKTFENIIPMRNLMWRENNVS